MGGDEVFRLHTAKYTARVSFTVSSVPRGNMLSYLYMTTRIISLLVLPILLLAAAPAHAVSNDTALRVSGITMMKMPPTCEVRSTKKRMTSGSVTEIVWKSDRATKMTGLTRDERIWPTKGRERVAIAFAGKHEFPLTFEGPGGKTTCIAKVFVKAKKTR